MSLHSIETWASTNCHTFGTKFYRTHHHSSSNSTAHLPPPHMDPSQVYHTIHGGTCNFNVGKYIPCGCASPSLSISILPPHTPNTPNSLHPHFSRTIFGKYTHSLIYFFIDLIKWSQYGGCKSLSVINWIILLCFSTQEIL